MTTSSPPIRGNTTLPTVAATEFWAFILTRSAPSKWLAILMPLRGVMRPMPMPMRMLDRKSIGTLVLAKISPRAPPMRMLTRVSMDMLLRVMRFSSQMHIREPTTAMPVVVEKISWMVETGYSG